MSRIDQALHELQNIDELANGSSPVHRFSPLCKLLVTVGYILTVMSFPKYALSELFLMILYPVSVSALSGIELRRAVKQVRYVLPLVMAVGLFNPLFDRTVIMYLGDIPVSGGFLSLVSLMMKGVFCLLASFFLIATTPADRLFASLRAIRMPAGMVTLLLLTWRYITVLGEEAAIMMRAYRLRAPGQKGLHWRTWGSFIGQLLLRTMDRGSELYESMRLRGYQGDFPAVRQEPFRLRDLLYALGWIGCFIVLRRYNIAVLIGRGGRIMIEFENVSFSYEKGKPVLDGISFRVRPGSKAGLIGANGAGKSTLLKLLCGLEQGSGKISVSGLPVIPENLPLVRRQLGFVMQNSDQQMFMPTVYEDMLFAPLNYGTAREEADRRIDEVLDQLKITELKYRHNHRLSGGEKRMAAIAVILANNPEVILMDEPTSALDPANRRMIIRTIRELTQTCLITSHDLDMILDTCETVILLHEGKVRAVGPAEMILHDRLLLEECHLELPLSLAGRK